MSRSHDRDITAGPCRTPALGRDRKLPLAMERSRQRGEERERRRRLVKFIQGGNSRVTPIGGSDLGIYELQKSEKLLSERLQSACDESTKTFFLSNKDNIKLSRDFLAESLTVLVALCSTVWWKKSLDANHGNQDIIISVIKMHFLEDGGAQGEDGRTIGIMGWIGTDFDDAYVASWVGKGLTSTRHAKTNDDLQKLTEEAKSFNKAGNKPQALRCLRRRKLAEKRISALQGKLDTIQSILERISMAETDRKVVSAYQMGVSALRSALKDVNLEKTESLVEQIQEFCDLQDDISQTLAGAAPSDIDMDADELERELDEILQKEVVDLPEVPTGPLITSPQHPPLIPVENRVHAVRLYIPFSMRVAVVYSPPGPSHQFLDHFANWLPHFLSCDIPTLIMGDFNIPIAFPLSPSASHHLFLTSSFGLSQHTNYPMHEDGNSLDLVFSRLCSEDDFTNSPLPLSDHNLLPFSSKNCHPDQVTPTFHTYRNIQAINTQKLMKNLQSSLAPISSISCPDSSLKHYNETTSYT
ncbi:unnamed protein product [Ranitomeya imitator]|uniref:Endonuclease/exonuclease/phosphatase domain-containing protein n=1 Tax=Ranitomeya imitator TaxID=111125 RepID=A0ABN9MAL4_9NEOB|nr:unnamed protein product [Ranitomeya imitator]